MFRAGSSQRCWRCRFPGRPGPNVQLLCSLLGDAGQGTGPLGPVPTSVRRSDGGCESGALGLGLGPLRVWWGSLPEDAVSHQRLLVSRDSHPVIWGAVIAGVFSDPSVRGDRLLAGVSS